MARRDADLAAEAKKNGGDGILLKAKQTDFLGTYPTGNATAITPAVTSPQPLAPAYPCRSFGEKGNISSSNM